MPRVLLSLAEHSKPVLCALTDVGHSLLMTASSDNSIKAYDLATTLAIAEMIAAQKDLPEQEKSNSPRLAPKARR